MARALQLIPAIDLRGGRCVRLLQGNFEAETRYGFMPADLLDKYRNFGADWLHIVDLDGAKHGTGSNHELIFALAARGGMRLQVGGGLRRPPDVEAMLDSGVERAVIGSAALKEVELVRAWLRRFGPDHIVLAFDVRLDASGVPRVATHGWRQQSSVSLWEALEPFADSDLKHVLCTDVARDGALTGPNIALYDEAARRYPLIEWQASGGIRSSQDLRDLQDAGAAAAISGKALLEALIPLAELRPFLPNA